MAYRKSYNSTDLEDVVTSATSLDDANAQLLAVVNGHKQAGDIIVYTETWQDLDTNQNNVWIGKVYYRAAGIV